MIGTAAIAVVACAVAARFLDAGNAAAAAVKVIAATLAIGVVPGVLVTTLWRPRAELTVLETIGFGMALSFGIVQLLTILAVTTHLGPDIVLAGAAVGMALAAVVVVRRNTGA